MSARRRLPSPEQVWDQVCLYAERCRVERHPLYTLAKYVPNIIQHVSDTRIERHSRDGKTQSAHINQGHVKGVWDELLATGRASTTGHPRVFTHALMLHALPEWIRFVSPNTIGLRGREPSLTSPLPTHAGEQPASERDGSISYDPRPGRRAGGEGPIHRALRMYIFEHPNEALVDLAGGPWSVCGTEHVLETQDRIDVVLRDGRGNYTLIEVKPKIVSDADFRELDTKLMPYAVAPFAQAAKYRTQWHMLYGTALEHIRCVVAAPEIPVGTLSRAMRRQHQVESVAVRLPADPA